MEKLPKDVVELITNKLSPKDFLNFCNSEVGKRFCSNEGIWLRRLQKDFGPFLKISELKYRENPKHVYLQLIVKVARTAENITNIILKRYGRKYLRFFPKKFSEKFVVKYLINLLNTFDFQDLDLVYDIAPHIWKHTSWEYSEGEYSKEVEEAQKEWWNHKFMDEVFPFMKEMMDLYLFGSFQS